jgi:hypothetical protein
MTIADSAREGKRGEGRSMPWAKLVGQIARTLSGEIVPPCEGASRHMESATRPYIFIGR